MNTNTMELNLNEMELVNGGGDILKGIRNGLYAGIAGGAFIGGVTLGFPGATFGIFVGGAGGAIVGGVIAAVTD